MEVRHTMKSVSKRTGLTPQLIRMWERRYKAVVPDRTSTGRRVYSDEDIRRLVLLKQATQAGESIGQIAGLPDEELLNLAGPVAPSIRTGEDVQSAESTLGYLQECLTAVGQFDAVSLESSLLRALNNLGQATFLEEVVAPLLEATGERWANGNFKVAHEHLVSAVVRSLLGGMTLTQPPDKNSPVIVLTTPAGQYHEFGILMASIVAASSGWQPVYLGPNMPAHEIASAVSEKNARAVALSVIYPHDDPRLPMELQKLGKSLTADVKIIVGGRAHEAYDKVLREIGAVRARSLTEWRHQLDLLRRIN